MNSELEPDRSAPAGPAASLRDRQYQATRQSILQAFLDLSHADGAVNVSIPAVAEVCGISVRTVYRHFGSKAELQTAAAYQISEQALHGDDVNTTEATNLLDRLKAMWSLFAQQMPAVMAEHASPAGRSIRATRLENARTTTRRALPDGAPEESVDLVVAVTSSSMFLELVDRMGHPPEVAAAMATRLAHLILADEVRAAEKAKGP